MNEAAWFPRDLMASLVLTTLTGAVHAILEAGLVTAERHDNYNSFVIGDGPTVRPSDDRGRGGLVTRSVPAKQRPRRNPRRLP